MDSRTELKLLQPPSVESGSGGGVILPWVTATDYVAGQGITNSGHTYLATNDHTSGATFAGDLGAHWALVPVAVADVVGAAPIASPTLTGNPAAPTPPPGDNDTSISTTAFVSAAITAHAAATDPHSDRAYADGLFAANDALVYKGAIDASASPNYPAASAGHLYKISVAGKIGGGAGANVEVGDSILCTVDGSAAGTQAAVGANWSIIQTNLDGAVIGPAVAVSGDFATFSGTGGKLIQDSGLALDTDGTLAANSDAKIPSQKAVKTAVDLKAPLASPALTGNPTAPTPSAADNDTSIATTAYVQTELAALVVLAPAASSRNVIQPTGAAVIPLVVKGAASQSADLFQIQSSAAAVLLKVNSAGWLTGPDTFVVSGGTNLVLTASSSVAARPVFTVQDSGGSTSYLTVSGAASVSTVRSVIKGITSQTGDLTQWQNPAGTTGLAVTAAQLLQWTASGNQQTTVGAAGGASALPATPTKFLKVVDSAGTTLVIPAYAAS